MTSSLLTGFPGFIGRRLAGHLLAHDAERRLTVLVEERMLEAARSAAAEIDAQHIGIVAADIGERRLGLSDEHYERLQAETRLVFHLAAIYDLAVPLQSPSALTSKGPAMCSSSAPVPARSSGWLT